MGSAGGEADACGCAGGEAEACKAQVVRLTHLNVQVVWLLRHGMSTALASELRPVFACTAWRARVCACVSVRVRVRVHV
eukprot:1159130-Pelagomonas_calceolata.AAC.16